jgi:UDP:flavonoid glycosyltransferase YjiC (YdhE family)
MGPESARTFGDLYLDCCPPPLQTRDVAVIATVWPVRPELFDGPPTGSVPDLARLPRPLAYVSFGTVPSFARADVLRTAATAAAAQAASVVVTTGPVPPAELGSLPENVRVAPYLPQRQVLEHADVLVSHGGAGSTLGGLLYGLPQLVLPQGAASQERCGTEIMRLGAGICLAPGEQAAASIGRAVEVLLSSGVHGRAAARVADGIARLPSVAAVAADIAARVA